MGHDVGDLLVALVGTIFVLPRCLTTIRGEIARPHFGLNVVVAGTTARIEAIHHVLHLAPSFLLREDACVMRVKHAPINFLDVHRCLMQFVGLEVNSLVRRFRLGQLPGKKKVGCLDSAFCRILDQSQALKRSERVGERRRGWRTF